MPIVIADNEQRTARSFLQPGVSHKYDYPYGLNLSPVKDSEVHDKIVDYVTTKALESYTTISVRYPDWNKIDESLTAYIRLDKKEKEVKQRDDRRPTSIVIPQSFATMEILLTYMTAALLEDTIFRYEGRSPEDIVGAILMEKLIDMQAYYTKMHLALYVAFRDAFAYGFGAVSPRWIKESAIVSRSRQKEPSIFDRLLGREPGMERFDAEELLFEGNTLDNIDPYLRLPDPNVPAHRVQDAEFEGWVERTNYMELLRREKRDETYFNVRYLDQVKGNSGISRLYRSDASARGRRSGIPDYNYLTPISTTRIDNIIMYCDILPKDWGLPGAWNNKNGEYPEVWLFEVAADTILIRAQRLGLNHNRKPTCVIAPDFDGYSVSPISRMEIMSGQQEVLNFLINSHILNVRKAINDMLIIDPSILDVRPLDDPDKAGLLLYIKRSAWGRGVDNAIKQLKVEDITRGNMQDAGMFIELMKNTSGSVDAISGVQRKTSERVTATEVQGDRFGATNRLEKIAKLSSWMGMHDLGYMLASQTQQLMSQETYVKIVGQWQEVLSAEYGVQFNADRAKVSPFDILVAYDCIVRDGTIPGGNFSQVWAQMLPVMMQDQELRQRMDIVRIVKHIMRNAGAKDVDQFDRKQMQQAPQINAEVMPDEQVARQYEAGNVIPLREGAGNV